MAFFGLFGKKNSSGGEDQPGAKYAAFGEVAQAEIVKFMAHVGKDWQFAVRHPNFERTPFPTHVKLFLDRHEHELSHGHFPHTHALVRAGKINFNDMAFDAMRRAVVTITELKLMDGFEKAGRKVS